MAYLMHVRLRYMLLSEAYKPLFSLAEPIVACFCQSVCAALQCQGKSFYDFLDDGSVSCSAASLRHLACEQRSEEESQAAQQAVDNAAEEQKQARDGPESEVYEQQCAEQQQAQHAQQQQQQKIKEHVAQSCSAYSKVFPARPMAL